MGIVRYMCRLPRCWRYRRADQLLRLDMRQISKINADEVKPGILSQEVVTHFLRQAEAFWLHDGNMSRPHAQLTSGKCSNGFVDVLRLLSYTAVCRLFARELVWQLRAHDSELAERIRWVVGSDHAGAVISHSVASIMKVRHDFTEKTHDQKGQLWKRHAICDDETMLQVEELITTFATLEAVRGPFKTVTHVGSMSLR